MILTKICRVATIIFVCMALFIPIAEAQTPFDITYCASGTMTTVSASEGLIVISLDSKGIAWSNHENKVFDNMTFHCAVVGKFVAGKPIGTGICKYMDPDGDIVVWDLLIDGPVDTFKAIQGTGKWKGIKAEGKAALITKAKPITPDTRQVCRKLTGTFELPKQAHIEELDRIGDGFKFTTFFDGLKNPSPIDKERAEKRLAERIPNTDVD